MATLVAAPILPYASPALQNPPLLDAAGAVEPDRETFGSCVHCVLDALLQAAVELPLRLMFRFVGSLFDGL